MCGIAGIVDRATAIEERELTVRRMLGTIRHRGPDQFGWFSDRGTTLGSARLSIVDLGGGQQPISNEDGSLWVVFNGEIFNHVELRAELETRGHRFATHTDTEVIVHLYEELGPACLEKFNGQFAIALWDTRSQSLFLARDRLGVRPLFYTQVAGSFLFASEIKALFVHPQLQRELDPVGLEQVFTFWAAQSPATVFRGIQEIPPGHCAQIVQGRIETRPYWTIQFCPEAEPDQRRVQGLVEEFRATLIDAVRLRLRADVPVGAYLSGGLDSSTIASIVRRYTTNRLDTFSIAFDDVGYDESGFQERMATELGTQHQVVRATHAQIGEVFPEVVWHAETPLLRTAPAPMFLLAQLVRRTGYKVVLTGEGADEFLCGYDIFKEDKVRRFWARQPSSRWRSVLLQRLYQDIAGLSKGPGAFLAAFFKDRLTEVECPWYSHLIRWRNTRRALRFFSPAWRAGLAESADALLSRTWDRPARANMPASAGERAQYWEIKTFLSSYLLSSQGDRMGMAHSVEGRFPFLDPRMVALCSRLPTRCKLRVLHDKHILRLASRDWLPAEINQRPKHPYRAPIHRSFFSPKPPAYLVELLSESVLARTGVFAPEPVRQLVRRVESGAALGETDDMALAGIISTQLLHHRFIERLPEARPIGEKDDVKCIRHDPSASGVGSSRT